MSEDNGDIKSTDITAAVKSRINVSRLKSSVGNWNGDNLSKPETEFKVGEQKETTDAATPAVKLEPSTEVESSKPSAWNQGKKMADNIFDTYATANKVKK